MGVWGRLNARDYLEGVRMIAGDLERTLGRIRRCDDQLELHGVRYDGDGGFSSTGERDAMSAGVVELMQYREYLDAIQSHYITLETEADFVIGSLGSTPRRRALALRYMDDRTFREIASRLDYSVEGARGLVDAGLRDLDGILVPLLQEHRKLTLSASDS